MELNSFHVYHFVRKVRGMPHKAGLRKKFNDFPVKTNALETHPTARNSNPLGKLPARVLYKDTTLFDSRVIFRYLDELSGAGLYSKNRLWDTLTLKALTDEIEESAILMVYETRLRPAGNRSEECAGAQWEKSYMGLMR